MESSFSTAEIVCPFEIESKFKKSDLIALKDSKSLKGKYFYAFKLPFHYWIKICPNGFNEKHHGETWIFFNVNGSKERKVASEFTISVESANYSRSFSYVYEERTGWGSTCCKTDDFFESKFFVDEEITIKVKGILKVERPQVSKISTPVSMQWKISKEVLQAKKESKNVHLYSKRKNVASFSDIKYCLDICQNITKNEEEPKIWIYLKIEMEKEKKVEAVFDFSVVSVNYNLGSQHIFEKSNEFGAPLCSIDDLLNPTKGYIVDEFLTINFNGILLFENDKSTVLNCEKQDFTIVIGEKEIKVNKQILMEASPIFAVMLESEKKESENKIVIEDFQFEVVDAATKLLHNNSDGIPQNFNLDDILSIYKFADQYQIQRILDVVENDLIKKVSPSNVVQLIQSTKSLNASKLYQSCINFLMKCAEKHTPVLGAENLDKNLVFTMFLNLLCPVDSDVEESDNEN